MKSIFSKIIAREIPAHIIAENDYVIVVEDINPKAPIHYLIIPKYEVKDIQSFEEHDFKIAEELFKMAQQLSRSIKGAEHFKLVINNGERAGQRVFHLHMHFLAGRQMED